MRAKAFAVFICGFATVAIVAVLFSYGRLLRTVETAATEAGVIDRAA